MRVLQHINQALHALMQRDPDLHFVGEDILDPYGGAFKVAAGLSTTFPERVLTSPISEAGIVGFASGMAMQGKPVIVEIMFGDFLGLAFDQILNHATKFSWMYNGQVSLPLIIRTPMGGGRGYGPTHSQSIEKHFCGIPGLTVMAIDEYGAPDQIYRDAYDLHSPVLIVENKILYARETKGDAALPRPAAPDVVCVAYGASVELCVAVAETMRREEEILVEVVPIRQLSPFPHHLVRDAIARCGRMVVVEEGSPGWGFGQECAYATMGMKVVSEFIAGASHPIPSARQWEDLVLPNRQRVARAVLNVFEA